MTKNINKTLHKTETSRTTEDALLEQFERFYPYKTKRLGMFAISIDWHSADCSIDTSRRMVEKKGIDRGRATPKGEEAEHPHPISKGRMLSKHPFPIISIRVIPFSYTSNNKKYIVFFTAIKECVSNYLRIIPLTKKVTLHEEAPHIHTFTENDHLLFVRTIQKIIHDIKIPVGIIYFPHINNNKQSLLANISGLGDIHEKEIIGNTAKITSANLLYHIVSPPTIKVKGNHNEKTHNSQLYKRIDRIIMNTKKPEESEPSNENPFDYLFCMPEQNWDRCIVNSPEDIKSRQHLITWINNITDNHNFGKWRYPYYIDDIQSTTDYSPCAILTGALLKKIILEKKIPSKKLIQSLRINHADYNQEKKYCKRTWTMQ